MIDLAGASIANKAVSAHVQRTVIVEETRTLRFKAWFHRDGPATTLTVPCRAKAAVGGAVAGKMRR